MNIRETVLFHLAETVEKSSPVPFPDDVNDSTRLDEFWLDSVAFAQLISRLDAELGFVPTAILEGAYYPETIREMVMIYEQQRSQA